MESIIDTTTTITLKLNKDEALWLKWIVQNTIHGTFETECQKDREMRKAFWDALITVES